MRTDYTLLTLAGFVLVSVGIIIGAVTVAIVCVVGRRNSEQERYEQTK